MENILSSSFFADIHPLKRKGYPVNDDRESKWPAILFFLTSGVFFFGCVWYLYAGAMNPDYYWQPSSPANVVQTTPIAMKNGRVVMLKNQTVRLGDACIVYRGIQQGAILMDLFILALDPDYGYAHRFDEDQAHHGFYIGEYHFQVMVAGDDKISLKRL